MSAGFMLVLLAAPMVSPAAGGATAKESEALQGTWLVTGGEADGQPLPEEEIRKKVVLTFTGDKLAATQAGKTDKTKLSYKLDLTQSPRAIDITPETAERGTIRGIYQLDGDRLKICLGEPGQERPKKFETSPSSRHKLMELRRTRP